MQKQTEMLPVSTSRREWKSRLSLGLAALACPCHLPIAVSLLAGTTLGAWLSQYSGVVTLVMLGVFIAALLYGLRGSNCQPSMGNTPRRASRTVRILDKGILWVSTLLVVALLGYSFSVEGFVLF